MNFQETTSQPNQKTNGWLQGYPTLQFPKFMGRTEQTIQSREANAVLGWQRNKLFRKMDK